MPTCVSVSVSMSVSLIVEGAVNDTDLRGMMDCKNADGMKGGPSAGQSYRLSVAACASRSDSRSSRVGINCGTRRNEGVRQSVEPMDGHVAILG